MNRKVKEKKKMPVKKAQPTPWHGKKGPESSRLEKRNQKKKKKKKTGDRNHALGGDTVISSGGLDGPQETTMKSSDPLLWTVYKSYSGGP